MHTAPPLEVLLVVSFPLLALVVVPELALSAGVTSDPM